MSFFGRIPVIKSFIFFNFIENFKHTQNSKDSISASPIFVTTSLVISVALCRNWTSPLTYYASWDVFSCKNDYLISTLSHRIVVVIQWQNEYKTFITDRQFGLLALSNFIPFPFSQENAMNIPGFASLVRLVFLIWRLPQNVVL